MTQTYQRDELERMEFLGILYDVFTRYELNLQTGKVASIMNPSLLSVNVSQAIEQCGLPDNNGLQDRQDAKDLIATIEREFKRFNNFMKSCKLVSDLDKSEMLWDFFFTNKESLLDWVVYGI